MNNWKISNSHIYYNRMRFINIKSKYILLPLILCLISTIPLQISASDKQEVECLKQITLPYIENYYKDDIDTDAKFFSMTQLDNQFLYFTNNWGLTEFNGISWNHVAYTYPKSVIKAGGNGRIYYYNNSNRVFGYFQSTNTKYFEEIDILSDKQTYSRAEGKAIQISDSLVYFVSESYIDVWDGKSIISLKTKSRYGASVIYKNQFLIQEFGKGLMQYQNDSLVLYSDHHILRNDFVHNILATDNQSLLFSVKDKGLYSMTNKEINPFNTISKDFLKGIQLHDGCFVYFIGRRGLCILDPNGKIVQLINEKNGLCDDMPSDLLQDKSGNIWVSTMNGISRIEYYSPYRWVDTGYDNIKRIKHVIKKDKQFYCFTENGFYQLNSDQPSISLDDEYSQYNFFQLIEKTSCHDLLLHKGKLYSTACEGIYEIEQSGVSKMSIYKDMPRDYIHQFRVSNYDSNRIFINTDIGIISLYHNKKGFEDEGVIFPLDYGGFFGDDKEGNAWFIRSKSLQKVNFLDNKNIPSRVNDQIRQKYYVGDTTKRYKYEAIYAYYGNIYVSIPGNIFVFSYAIDSFVRDSVLSKMLSKTETITRTYKQQDNDKIILEIIDVSDLTKTRFVSVNNHVYDDWGYLKISPPNHISFRNDSSFWICDIEGLILYNRLADTLSDNNLNVSISKIKIGEDSVFYPRAQTENIPTFSYKNNSIDIEYTINSFDKNKKKKQFQYNLSNLNDSWSEWNRDNVTNLFNLKEGNYTFTVRGRDNTGEITPETHFSFKISPPWYRTWYSYITYNNVSYAVPTFSLFSEKF